eukprot:2521046-Amphidinium_carterae.2
MSGMPGPIEHRGNSLQWATQEETRGHCSKHSSRLLQLRRWQRSLLCAWLHRRHRSKMKGQLPQATRRKTGTLGRRSNAGETGPGVVAYTPGAAGAPTGSPNKKHRPLGQVINGVARESRPNICILGRV